MQIIPRGENDLSDKTRYYDTKPRREEKKEMPGASSGMRGTLAGSIVKVLKMARVRPHPKYTRSKARAAPLP